MDRYTKKVVIAFSGCFILWWAVVVMPVYLGPMIFGDVPGEKGQMFQRWESAETPVKVRVDAHHELGGFLPGAFYTFQSPDPATGEWREVMTVRHDDPVDIPVKVMDSGDSVTAVYMYENYAVTTDGGATWHKYSIYDSIAEKAEPYIFYSIDSMRIGANGEGYATLDVNSSSHPSKRVRTRDFGRTWE